MPEATLKPAGGEFIASKCYRYVVQDYIRPERELRAYVTCSPVSSRVTLLNMPVAPPETPDWRGTLLAKQFPCSVVEEAGLSDLCERLRSALGLDYVCFDFIEKDARYFLVDANPNGTWHWLPENERRLVNDQLGAWLIGLAGAA